MKLSMTEITIKFIIEFVEKLSKYSSVIIQYKLHSYESQQCKNYP